MAVCDRLAAAKVFCSNRYEIGLGRERRAKRAAVPRVPGDFQTSDNCLDEAPVSRAIRVRHGTPPRIRLHPKARLHRTYIHPGSGRVPCELEIATAARFLKGDRKVLDWGTSGSGLHIHAREILFLTGIVRAPLAGLLADDERPLVLAGKGEERVAARRNVRAADHDVPCGDEGSGFIRAGSPDLAILHDIREDVAAFLARAGVVNGDRLPAGKFALRRSGWTRALGFVLLSLQGACDGKGEHQRTTNDWDLTHASSSYRTTQSHDRDHSAPLSRACHLTTPNSIRQIASPTSPSSTDVFSWGHSPLFHSAAVCNTRYLMGPPSGLSLRAMGRGMQTNSVRISSADNWTFA